MCSQKHQKHRKQATQYSSTHRVQPSAIAIIQRYVAMSWVSLGEVVIHQQSCPSNLMASKWYMLLQEVFHQAGIPLYLLLMAIYGFVDVIDGNSLVWAAIMVGQVVILGREANCGKIPFREMTIL